MPFRAGLHYFYLYLERHVSERHGIECKRGDSDILTVPLLDKIWRYIEEADVILADCSGRNANVFYELGMAHTLKKKVILMTSDSVSEAPTDIRHFEFIHYDLSRHTEFLESLGRALRRVFIDRFDRLFELGVKIYQEFRQATGAQVQMAGKDVFDERVLYAERINALPLTEDGAALREFLLPRIIADNNDVRVMRCITDWLTKE
jgi:hypothetical protein